MKISFAAPAAHTGAIAVPAFDKARFSAAAAEVDKACGGALSRAVKASRFTGKAGETLEVTAPAGLDAGRVVIFGLGDEKKAGAGVIEKAAAAVVKKLLLSGETAIGIRLDGVADAEGAARAGLGARLAAYRFDGYRTKLTADKKPSLKSVTVLTSDEKAAKAAWKSWEPVAEGVELARDLVMEPANVLSPPAYARRMKKLEKDGLEVEVLGEAEMKKLGMGSLLGVGQGSAQESQMVILRWNGGKKGDRPLVFVGKGVTFDTGGISLKPGDGMWDMKGDMGGSAAVAGLMKTLAGRKAKVNAIGVLGLVENMPDGKAQRPGDIVTSMSGQTIEVLNTDAEGRLVLADALWYAQDRFDPEFMINLATLTGAILIALGQEHAGIFSNNDRIAERLSKAGEASGEPVWRLPLGPAYDKQIDSPVADMKNIGQGRLAGSITAAQFLQRFVNSKPWCHIDIAGTAWKDKSDDPREPSWGTGYGVRLLDRFIRDYYEK
ncbi:MAG: leucyl aminopeptidase [Maricaulaceae bacterium]|nr:leucyl aminopeptidase [Maricaulaceae bacterium]